MALPKTKAAIKPRKLKTNLFAKSWGHGASANWKTDYFERMYFRRQSVVKTDIDLL